MEGTCLRLADAIFSSSACSADCCAEHYGLDREKIPVLHTGVDTVHFSPRETAAHGRPTIIFVGRVSADKGAMHLLEASCRLVSQIPDLKLTLVGGGKSQFLKELQQRAIQLSCPNLLDQAGFVSRDELPYYLSRATVFALPSHHEPGPGLVYLEAMACGLPVIGCDNAGAAEVVRDGETGLLVPPKNVRALETALQALLLDVQRRSSMARRARQYVVEAFDSRQCIKKIEALYSSVVSQARVGCTR